MAKRSKKSMAKNIKKHFSASTASTRVNPEKIAEQNARAIDQIGNVMIMLTDILSGQEEVFAQMVDILSVIPETSGERQKQAEMITKKSIDAILKIEKQIEKESDPEKKKKLQGAIDVLKTQGVSAYSMARPQKLPSSFSEMLQNAIFGVTPDRKERAGGLLPAIGQVAKDKMSLAKMMFGIFPKQKTGSDGFEALLENNRKRMAGQEKIIESSSVVERMLKKPDETEPDKTKKKKSIAVATPKETLDFYDNVLEGLNIIVMNQDKANELLSNITPTEGDSGTHSPSPITADAIPDTPVTPADDLISGYGERTLITPTRTYALNNEDDVVSGTNLFPKGSVRVGGLSSSPNMSGVQLLSASSRTNADDIATMADATSLSTTVSPSMTGVNNGTTINNIDNSTNMSGGGGNEGSSGVVYIRDVHNSHVRFQEKRLTSLLA